MNMKAISDSWVMTNAGSYANTWSQIDEDEEGNLLLNNHALSSSTSQADQIRIRRKRLAKMDHAQTSRRIRRDMIRYVYLMMDLSEAMFEKDSALGTGYSSDAVVHRKRIEVALDLLQELVGEYFHQNPLSHLGIIICANGEAQLLSPLSGNKRNALSAIGAIRDGIVSSGRSKKDAGVFSLQNGLRVAGLSLGFMPEYGSREIIALIASLSTCDSGDIIETLNELQKSRIRVNCLSFCAELHVCKKICEQTGGIMAVALDGRHLRDTLMGLVTPPPVLLDIYKTEPTCEFIAMGFPTRDTDENATLIHPAITAKRESKLLFARTGYVCPQCKSRASELPMDCSVCGLKLVLAPHLARSFHHLFPVPPFEEVDEGKEICCQDKAMNVDFKLSPSSSIHLSDTQQLFKLGYSHNTGMKEFILDNNLLLTSEDCDRGCFLCLKPIGLRNLHDMKKKRNRPTVKLVNSGSSLRFQCPECKNLVCADCDAFIHETLHNCPGCIS